MSITIHMLARIADDVYFDNGSIHRDATLSCLRLNGTFVPNNSRGFQGVIYQNGTETIVAYRGTATKGGVTADVRLALRNMPGQVADAIKLYDHGVRLHGNRGGKLIVCGHSLGGYLTQAICGMKGAWGIAFNAAGARSLFTGRVMGLGATFGAHLLPEADKKVLNVTVQGDPVSARIAGKRIGKKMRLACFGNILSAHLMSTVKTSLSVSLFGDFNLEQGLKRASAMHAD
jgi:hypothetical protein